MTRTLFAACVAACLLMPAAADAKKKKKDDEDEEAVDFKHPWASDRFWIISEEAWKKNLREKPDAYYERFDEVREFEAGGAIRRTVELEIKVNDPSSMPASLVIGWLSSADATTIEEFEGTYAGVGRTDVLGRDRLIEASPESDDIYISGDLYLQLLIPTDRPGTLTVRLVTRSEPREGFEDYFGGAVFLHRGAPAARRSITLIRPAGMPLELETRFFRTKATKTEADGKATVRYDFERLNGAWWNPGMPSPFDSYPVLLYSNLPDWAALGARSSALFEPQIGTTDAMEAWVAAELEGVDGDAARALAIHDLVADGWGYLGFYPAESGWKPHPSTDVFDSRVGDCKDQTTLMVSLMRSVGIDASPALINGGDRFRTPKVPIARFNPAVVYVHDEAHPDGGYLLDSVDTGTGAYPTGQWLESRYALVLDPDGAFLIDTPAAPSTAREHTEDVRVELAGDGSARILIEERWTGNEANRRLSARRGTSPAVWERKLRERYLAAVPGGRIESLTEGIAADDPEAWTVRAELASAGLAELQGRYAVLRVPWLTRWSGRDVRVAKWRIHPRELRGRRTVARVTLVLPDGAEVISHPGDDADDRDDFDRSLTTTRTDEGLVVELVVEIEAGRMKRRFEELRRTFYDDVKQTQQRPVVLFMPTASEGK